MGSIAREQLMVDSAKVCRDARAKWLVAIPAYGARHGGRLLNLGMAGGLPPTMRCRPCEHRRSSDLLCMTQCLSGAEASPVHSGQP